MRHKCVHLFCDRKKKLGRLDRKRIPKGQGLAPRDIEKGLEKKIALGASVQKPPFTVQGLRGFTQERSHDPREHYKSAWCPCSTAHSLQLSYLQLV